MKYVVCFRKNINISGQICELWVKIFELGIIELLLEMFALHVKILELVLNNFELRVKEGDIRV